MFLDREFTCLFLLSKFEFAWILMFGLRCCLDSCMFSAVCFWVEYWNHFVLGFDFFPYGLHELINYVETECCFIYVCIFEYSITNFRIRAYLEWNTLLLSCSKSLKNMHLIFKNAFWFMKSVYKRVKSNIKLIQLILNDWRPVSKWYLSKMILNISNSLSLSNVSQICF